MIVVWLTSAGFKKLQDAYKNIGSPAIAQFGRMLKDINDLETLSENTIRDILKGTDKAYHKTKVLDKFENKLNKRLVIKRRPKISLIQGADYLEAPTEQPAKARPAFEIYSPAISVLSQCHEHAILGIYQRHDREFRAHVSATIENAQEFVYTIARTYRNSLITDNDADWLFDPIQKASKCSETMPIRMLMADCFNNSKSAHLRQLAMFSPDLTRTHKHAGRDTLSKLLIKLDGAKNVKVRVLDTPIFYFMVATESRVFWEAYRPTGRGGSGLIFEIGPTSGKSEPASGQGHRTTFLSTLVTDFCEQYNKAADPVDVISEYLSSHTQVQNAEDPNYRFLEDYKEAKRVAELWSSPAELLSFK